MTALLILAKVFVVLAAGFVVYRALRFPDRVDEGRVRSDAPRFYRPARYRRQRDQMMADPKLFLVNSSNGRMLLHVGLGHYVIPPGLYTQRELDAHLQVAFAEQDQINRHFGAVLTAGDLASIARQHQTATRTRIVGEDIGDGCVNDMGEDS